MIPASEEFVRIAQQYGDAIEATVQSVKLWGKQYESESKGDS